RGGAMNDDIGQSGEKLSLEGITELRELADAGGALLIPNLERHGKGASERDRLRSRSPARLLKPAEEEGRERHIMPHDQGPAADRPAELMGGDSHRRRAERAEINRQLAGGLNGVDMQ